MKLNTKIKTTLLSSTILIVSSYTSTVLAHDYQESLKAAFGASATDLYRIDCSQDSQAASQSPTHQLFVQIRDDSAAGGKLSATASVFTPGFGKATTVTDPAGGDVTLSPSKALTVIGADAQDVQFFIAVSHSATGLKNYVLSYHCQDASGQHTGTALPPAILQNQ
jgi:hypothetical protein